MPFTSPPIVHAPGRLAALGRTGLLDTLPEESFDRLTRLASRLLNTPIALVCLIDQDRQFFKSAVGLGEPWASRREMPLAYSYCQHALESAVPLVVDDARLNPVLADSPAVSENGSLAYVGVPLTSEGESLGTLCVVDTRVRHWTDEDVQTLADLAAGAQAEIDLRRAGRLARAGQQYLRALVDAQQAVSAAGTLPRVMREVVLRACLLTRADAAVVETPDGNEMVCRAACGTAEHTVGARHPLGTGISGLALGAGELFHAADTDEAVGFDADACRAAGMRSVITVPFAGVDGIDGVLHVTCGRPHAFSEADVNTVQLLATLLGAALQQDQRLAREQALVAELGQSEERYRAVVETLNEAVLAIDDEGVIRFANPAAEAIFGYAAPELAGQPVRLLLPGHTPGHLAGVRTAEARGVHRTGREIPLEASFAEYRRGGERIHVGVLRDVTDRMRAEREAREAGDALRALVNASPLAIITLDERGDVTLWNPAAERIFGWAADEVLGRPVPFVPERFRDEHRTRREQVLAGAEISGLEALRLRRDGTLMPVSVSVAPLPGRDGGARGLVSFTEDITQRLETRGQLEAYSRELERSNRELQDFAYVASHDLQEPLRKIQAFGDRLQSQYAAGLGEEGADYLRRMQAAAMRMRSLIQDLLAFARVTSQARPFAPVPLEQVAHEVAGDLQARIDETGARVEIGALPQVEADASQMRQLLQNLIANALKFHRDGVAPVVRITAAPAEGGMTAIRVRDNGIGFDERYLDRIFTPFERLHGRREYEGTGIGLAICRKIAERHGGGITAHSTPGEGATFVVTLPVSHSAQTGVR
ncbi:PAS domain S-box protein [Longimicrobium terrae]|uniref:histidine kinase n=1 Tax=Longimicrobium terrae TaxID=1639882 RepID=A0A841GYH2_9BACT|nr:PAS domain S-box protein [Longimicrobium terrae]MBB4636682.1 PAS domain S-box-containing protein [Longimicrobium terrae]MBB6070794.1 PAS domain S-box-containing protein [Longimicrobium terrae]NNC28820.1 PAS domain S-box protein [Longimicrobium terrae]